MASLVLLHGALISPEQYVQTAQQIQQASSLSLWIGLPTVDLNAPGAVPKAINRIVSEMKSQGMVTDAYFYGGHSLGTVKIQGMFVTRCRSIEEVDVLRVLNLFLVEYCFEFASNCTGQVLLAGTQHNTTQHNAT